MDAQILVRAATRRLIQAGVDEDTARAVVDHMVAADRWGRPTHGLSVRFESILRQAEQGVGARPVQVVADRGTSVLVDANNGFGYAAGARCTDLLVERVRQHGLGAVALKNTGHTGMLGYYADRGARADVVTLGFAHCRPMVAPFGGKTALLGTNPLTFGLPAEPHPILVDMGTSAVSNGTVMVCRQEGKSLPEGCALDADGNPTVDPDAVGQGCLLPFGGHRGGALAVAIQLLAGALTGAGVIPPAGKDYGLLLIGLEKGLFAGDDGYEGAIREFIERYQAVPAREGCEVRLPGSGRYRGAKEREAAELEVSAELVELLDLRR